MKSVLFRDHYVSTSFPKRFKFKILVDLQAFYKPSSLILIYKVLILLSLSYLDMKMRAVDFILNSQAEKAEDLAKKLKLDFD